MRKKLNEGVISGEAWVSAGEKVIQYGWPVIAGFIGMTGLGAFFASGWADLAAHGWGAIAFAGLAAACIVTLSVSAGLVAWRYFNPLAPTASSPDELPPTVQNENKEDPAL